MQSFAFNAGRADHRIQIQRKSITRAPSGEEIVSWVSLITDTPDGRDLSPPGLAAALIAAYAEEGLNAVRGGTYSLHPATAACASAQRWPGRLLCLELRRDLLVERWTPFSPMQAAPDAVARLSGPLIQALHAALSARGV